MSGSDDRDQHDAEPTIAASTGGASAKSRRAAPARTAGAAGGALARQVPDRGHARSPSCWPSRPAGRKTSTRMRTAKTTASAQRGEPELRRDDLDEADDEAAQHGPVMLPMPPRTAAVNALRPASKPRLNWMLPKYRP